MVLNNVGLSREARRVYGLFRQLAAAGGQASVLLIAPGQRALS
jgi:hypothetical protein